MVRFPGTTPEVTPVAIGALAWRSARLDLLPGDDPAAVDVAQPRREQRQDRGDPGVARGGLRCAHEEHLPFPALRGEENRHDLQHAKEAGQAGEAEDGGEESEASGNGGDDTDGDDTKGDES